MRVFVFALCALFTLGIFVTMLLSIWSTRDRREAQLLARQSLVGELVWAAIPCLMIVAAAIPAGVAILTPSLAAPRKLPPLSVPARGATGADAAQRRSVRSGPADVASAMCLPVRLLRTPMRHTSLQSGEPRRHETDSSQRAQPENGAEPSNSAALVGQPAA